MSYYFEGEDPELLARAREHTTTLLHGMSLTRLTPDRSHHLVEVERHVVHSARQLGMTWDDIAAAIGITAEQAREQYGEAEES